MSTSSGKPRASSASKTAGEASTGTVAAQLSTAPRAHLTVAERAARGRAMRSEVGRSSHAAWEPSSDWPDPVELLEQQASDSVEELVPIQYGRMLVSPLHFYRGAAYGTRYRCAWRRHAQPCRPPDAQTGLFSVGAASRSDRRSAVESVSRWCAPDVASGCSEDGLAEQGFFKQFKS